MGVKCTGMGGTFDTHVVNDGWHEEFMAFVPNLSTSESLVRFDVVEEPGVRLWV